MVLVGAVTLPHALISLDGEGAASPSESCRRRYAGLPQELQTTLTNLFKCIVKTCQNAASLKPDLVVLHTPHGISLSKSLGVYLNDVAKGDAAWKDEWADFKVEVPLDKAMSEKIIEHLETEGINVQGVRMFDVLEAPLRWGEVVPLWYLNREFEKSHKHPKYVIISQPIKEMAVKDVMIDIGRSLGRYFDQTKYRTLFVASGDLSHAHFNHYKNIPEYSTDAKWGLPQSSSKAELFDCAIMSWVISQPKNSESKTTSNGVWNVANAHYWLSKAGELEKETYSCGLGGFFVLHGILSQCNKPIYSRMFGRFAPSYYGMMASSFIIKNENSAI